MLSLNGVLCIPSDFSPLAPAVDASKDAYIGTESGLRKKREDYLRPWENENPDLARKRKSAIDACETNLKPHKSHSSYTHGPFLPAIEEKIVDAKKEETYVDALYAHADDLNDVVGAMSWVPQGKGDMVGVNPEDYGFGTHSAIPVVALYRDEAERREDILVAQQLAFSSGTSVPAEVLPGEVICKDGIIRRESALHAMVDDGSNDKVYTDAKKVSIGVARLAAKDGKMVIWRPTGGQCNFAYVIEEGE